MPRPSLNLVPAVALSLAFVPACGYEGELGQLEMQFTELVDPAFEFESGERLLVDTRICPAIVAVIVDEDSRMWLGEEKGADYRQMLEESVTGPGTLDEDGCIALEEAGEVVWDLNMDGEPFERFRFTAVDVDATTQLGFDRWQMRIGHSGTPGDDEEHVLGGLAPGRDLDELLVPPDTTRYVYANSVDVPLLRLDDADGRVFYTAETLAFEVDGEGFELVEPVPNEDEPALDEFLRPGELSLRFEPGGRATVRTTLPNGEVRESPELVAVDLSDAASLDLMHVDNEYLFADVRDAHGVPIHAAPITWQVVEGSLAIYPGSLARSPRSPEYAWVGPQCEAPPEDEPELRQATVRARLGELEDTVVVEWIAEPPSESSPPWEAPEDCQYAPPVDGEDESEGCSCSSEPRTPVGWSVVVLGVLVVMRRRKFGHG